MRKRKRLKAKVRARICMILACLLLCGTGVSLWNGKRAEKSVSNIDTEPEVLNPADVAEFKSRMIEHFRRKDTLQQSLLELQELYENGPILERIEKARMYSQRSRYRDFETTLDILFEGMDAETLRDDLLRMEVLRYRRLPYRQENTTGNLV